MTLKRVMLGLFVVAALLVARQVALPHVLVPPSLPPIIVIVEADGSTCSRAVPLVPAPLTWWERVWLAVGGTISPPATGEPDELLRPMTVREAALASGCLLLEPVEGEP